MITDRKKDCIMVKECYVSFEVAKSLKKKEFRGECLMMYLTPKHGNTNEFKIAPHGRDSSYYDGYLYQCEAPSHQVVMKWLREKYNICITIYPAKENGYEAVLYDIENDVEILLQSCGVYRIHIYEETYEKATEEAIKYCLENLI